MKPLSSSSSHEDILMKGILQTHSPAGHRIDPTPLLQISDNIIRCITMVDESKKEAIYTRSTGNGEVVYKRMELGGIIYHISKEILRVSSREQSSHTTTMVVLELLGNHSWDTKVAIVIAALAMSYGEFWLVTQLCSANPLASSIVMLKGLTDIPEITSSFQRQFKALRILFKKMIDTVKCMLEFSSQYLASDYGAMAGMKADIHMASYWVIRSAVTCTSQINRLLEMKNEQVRMNLISARWELWSSVCKISVMHYQLQKQLDDLNQQKENSIHSCLLHLFEEVHVDNQTVLNTLFATKDDFPLRHGSSQEKISMAALTNKEVILLISRPGRHIEKFLLVMQQLWYTPVSGLEKPYEILWVPIASSFPWSSAEKKDFNQVLGIFPWYSLQEPSTMSFSVIKFIQDKWHFQMDPLMVVLDSKGKVTSLNAIDMVSIWGEKAYPFSALREKELWQEQSLTMDLLMDEIDPLISYWVEDGRVICLYGSNNLEWVRELTSKMNEIIGAGVMLALVYVGNNCFEHSGDIIATIIKEKLSSYLPHTKINFFWLRLESMRSSKLRAGGQIESDFIMKEVNSLLSLDSGNRGWLLIGEGSSTNILKLFGNKVIECLSLFELWGEYISKLGFLGAIKKALDPPLIIDHCNKHTVIPYVEDLSENILFCKNCNFPMKKNILYQCKRS